MALQMPPKAQGIEPDPLLPKAVADDWSDRLADAEAAARARREADIAHKSEILRAAKEAVMEATGLPEPKAKAVIQAIASGLVPNVAVSF